MKVLVLEPSKVLMPSYVAVNKNANDEGEVISRITRVFYNSSNNYY